MSGAFGSFAMNASAAFFAIYAIESGLPPSVAGIVVAVGSIAAIATRLTVGAWADRSRLRIEPAIAGLLATGAVGFLILAAGKNLMIPLGGLFVFVGAWGWTSLFHLRVVRDNTRSPGSATGSIMSGFYLGAAIGPAAFGTLAHRMSYTAAWQSLALLCLLGAGALLRSRAAVPQN